MDKKEAVIVIVGFLGAGKTTLLKRLVNHYLYGYWQPYVILNDYQNAQLDAQQFLNQLEGSAIEAISGSCICCDGINELRRRVNAIPRRDKGITFIEANGTTDAYTLMGFLGVGLKEQFQSPVQIAIVDARYWQKRGEDNELEANQVQVSSMIVLNYADQVSGERLQEVKSQLLQLNEYATLTTWSELEAEIIPQLTAIVNPQAQKMDHKKSHWSSCSVNLPDPMPANSLNGLFAKIPKSVLRVKGCTRFGSQSEYTFFERTPTGEVSQRPFRGQLVSGPQLLMIGPGSDPELIRHNL